MELVDSPDDYFKSTTQLEAEAQADEELRVTRESDVMAFHRLFMGEDGERVLSAVSSFCSEHDDLFIPESDATRCYLLGRRSVILFVRNMLKETIK